MTYDASNRKDVRDAEKASRLHARQDGEVVIALCSTAAGRRWVWDRLAEARVFATTFSADPYTSAFNEGQRNQGLMLLAQISTYCPEQLTLAQQEANVRDATAERSREPHADGRDQGPELRGEPDDT